MALLHAQVSVMLAGFMAHYPIALRSAALAGVGVVHLPLLIVSDEIRNGQLVHLLPNWAPARYVAHAVYPSRRGLLPSVRALLDYLGARFGQLRED